MTDRATWLADRRRGLGGSDIAAVLGWSRYRSPLDVWRDKAGLREDEPETPPQRRGRLLEDAVATWYGEETGLIIAPPRDRVIIGPEPWMLASIDRYAVDPRDNDAPPIILECKTTGSDAGWGPSGSAEVPAWYLPQVAWYLHCTGLPRADVALLLVGTRDDATRWRRYTFTREDAAPLLEAAVPYLRDWWHRCVVGDEEPPVTTPADVVWRYPRAGADVREATADEAAIALELAEVRRHKALLEDRETDLEVQIKAAIGEARGIRGPWGRVLWAESKGREIVDAAALRKAHPNIAREFAKVGAPSRRFTPEFIGQE